MSALLSPVERAVYRALARYRISAAQRQRLAQKVVAVLADVPIELLPGVVSLGQMSAFAHDLAPAMWSVSTDRRVEVAAVAIAAAAAVMCEGTES